MEFVIIDLKKRRINIHKYELYMIMSSAWMKFSGQFFL